MFNDYIVGCNCYWSKIISMTIKTELCGHIVLLYTVKTALAFFIHFIYSNRILQQIFSWGPFWPVLFVLAQINQSEKRVVQPTWPTLNLLSNIGLKNVISCQINRWCNYFSMKLLCAIEWCVIGPLWQTWRITKLQASFDLHLTTVLLCCKVKFVSTVAKTVAQQFGAFRCVSECRRLGQMHRVSKALFTI